MKKLLINCGEVVTHNGNGAIKGSEMSNISVLKNLEIEITEGIISNIGSKGTFDYSKYEIIDANGCSILPGFVDSHTHYCFAGNRCDEFFLRAEGKSYLEIMKQGGGINNTVKATKEISFDRLIDICKKRLNKMISLGITTVEGKSGYGLDLENEIKQLEIMKKLNEIHPIETVITYLGGHAVPEKYNGNSSKYIDFMVNEVLPIIKKRKLAEFCDIFCEEGVFSIEESEKFMKSAKNQGFGLKIHADEIVSLGGAELAARVGAISAEHLLAISEQGINSLALSDTIAVILPCTAYCLGSQFAPARKLINAGCAVALASDYNPGSCNCNNIPLLISLAFMKMKMSLPEIITALTINAAAAVNRAEKIGTIEVGKQADMLILDTSDYRDLIYCTGDNLVERVIKKGKVVFQKSGVVVDENR